MNLYSTESPQFSIEELEEKVIRMVEIAAETCEKLSQMDQEQQSEIAALGTEYITLAKDIKTSLKAHVSKLIDLPLTTGTMSSLKDFRELETSALRTQLILRQLESIKNDFGLIGEVNDQANRLETNEMQE